MDTDSNLPQTSAGVVAPIAGQQSGSAGKMTLGEIFSRAFDIYKENPLLIVPSLIPIAALIIGLLLFAGFMGLAAIFGGDGFLAVSAVGGMLLFIILLIVLFFIAEGITIEMVQEASAGNKADLNRAWEDSKAKMGPLILSSILAGVITVLGYVLLVVPGIILSFVFYFVAQTVMIDGRSGMEALKESYVFVKENLSDSIVLVLVFLVIGFLLPMTPLIGPILSLLALPFLYATATLFYLDRREMPSPRAQTKVDVS